MFEVGDEGGGHGVGFQSPDGVHGEALLAMFTHDTDSCKSAVF